MLGAAKKLLSRVRYLECLPYLFSKPEAGGPKVVLVTGADSSHFKSLQQFLRSVVQHEPMTPTWVYDLGLSNYELESLRTEFPGVRLKRFEFERYPSYFDIKKDAGHYAWKPLIMWEVLNTCRGPVCWMDAGNVLTRKLTFIRRFVLKRGIYSPVTANRIIDWSHPTTLKRMRLDHAILRKRNLMGGCIAADWRNLLVRDVMKQWKDLALSKEDIAPEGSNRANHRQDQTLISILAHQAGIAKGMPKNRYGFRVHQDVD